MTVKQQHSQTTFASTLVALMLVAGAIGVAVSLCNGPKPPSPRPTPVVVTPIATPPDSGSETPEASFTPVATVPPTPTIALPHTGVGN